jgi:hypothetical protein
MRKGDVHELRIELGRDLAGEAVLLSDPGVGEEHEEGVVHELQICCPVQEAAQPAVYHRDLGSVEVAHPLQLALGEVVARAVGR